MSLCLLKLSQLNKYYQENKERLQKKVVNVTKISQNFASL